MNHQQFQCSKYYERTYLSAVPGFTIPSDRYLAGTDEHLLTHKSWELRYEADLAAITGVLPGEF